MVLSFCIRLDYMKGDSLCLDRAPAVMVMNDVKCDLLESVFWL